MFNFKSSSKTQQQQQQQPQLPPRPTASVIANAASNPLATPPTSPSQIQTSTITTTDASGVQKIVTTTTRQETGPDGVVKVYKTVTTKIVTPGSNPGPTSTASGNNGVGDLTSKMNGMNGLGGLKDGWNGGAKPLPVAPKPTNGEVKPSLMPRPNATSNHGTYTTPTNSFGSHPLLLKISQSKPLIDPSYRGPSLSEISKPLYKKADAHAIAAPSKLKKDLKELVKHLTEPFEDPVLKLRACFRWITENVAYDTGAVSKISLANNHHISPPQKWPSHKLTLTMVTPWCC
jgi:hypothetical protein